jgi:hypothetical protein
LWASALAGARKWRIARKFLATLLMPTYFSSVIRKRNAAQVKRESMLVGLQEIFRKMGLITQKF